MYNMGVAMKNQNDIILVCSPSPNFEKNAQRLKPDQAEGYQILELTNISTDSPVITELPWSDNQDKDANNPHCHRSTFSRSVLINDRLYVFSNLSPENKAPVKVIDFTMSRMFPIHSPKHAPSVSRINYSLSQWKHKVYLYGGLDSSNKILESMDEFDASLYKFN